MPKMDGFQLHDEIKKDQKAKVCFLTVYYEEFRKKEYRAIDKILFYPETNL
jgi:CheY-like chemotaxis protein